MKKQVLAVIALQLTFAAFTQPLRAQQAPVMSTPAASEAEKEAFYAKTIENRMGDILKALNSSDPANQPACP